MQQLSATTRMLLSQIHTAVFLFPRFASAAGRKAMVTRQLPFPTGLAGLEAAVATTAGSAESRGELTRRWCAVHREGKVWRVELPGRV